MSPSFDLNTVLHTTTGKVNLGSLLGRGGEGAIFDIPGDPSVVAKIYHKPVDAEKIAKLETLASMRSDRLLRLAAWPTEVLRNAKGDACGFIMPRITGCKDIHTLYNPRSRKSEFPQADWRFLIRASANTARAFAELHRSNCVIGDVNPGGIAVSEQATVRLIDCDSVQVQSGSQVFSCDVGTPLFTAPELQKSRTFRGILRTAKHDNFGLAVVIFQLLSMGRHPFAGRFLGPGEMGIEKAIAEFRFAYGATARAMQMEAPPGVPPLNSLSLPIVELFESAFSREAVKGSRPTASQWVTALETLESKLKKCATNASHFYFRGLLNCPWCRFEAATGAMLFSAPNYQKPAGTVFDLAGVWSRISAVERPSPPPPALSKDSFGPFKASGEACALSRFSFGKAFGVVLVIALALFLVIAFRGDWLLWAIGGFFLISMIVKGDPNRQKILEFEVKHKTAGAHYRTTKQRWDRYCGDQGFGSKLSELDAKRQEWQSLGTVRQRRIEQLQRESQKQQLNSFLDKHTIDKADIAGVGASRKVVLQSYNIETALDVSPNMHVPGFGPALTDKLIEWRRGVERLFVYDPRRGVDPRDVAALDRDIDEERQKLEHCLSAGAGELILLRNRAMMQRKVMESQLVDAYKLMLQAEADVIAAKR